MKRRLPEITLLAAIAFAVGWGCLACKRDPVFKVFDQADVALVAHNILDGKGFTTDAIWLWATDWGTTHHPEGDWPPLQSYITAGFFLVLGESVAAQKAVNVAFLVALLCATYFAGSRLFGKWHGALAAALVLPNARIPDNIGYGLNDIGATFFNVAAMFFLYRALEDKDSRRDLVIGSILAGLAILQKFQSVFVPLAFALANISKFPSAPKKIASRLVVHVLVLAAIGAPLMIRNYRMFGALVYPSSKLAANLGASYDASYNRWRALMVYYKPYWKHQQPTLSYRIEKRGAFYVLVKRPVHELGRIFKQTATGVIVGTPIFLLGLLGTILAWKTHKSWFKWGLMNFAASLWFALLRGTEPRYYLFLIPLFALPASFAIIRMASWFSKSRLLLGAFALIVAAGIVYPVAGEYLKATRLDGAGMERDRAFVNMCEWLKTRLSEGEGTMTWNAGETAYHTGHGAATPPNVDLAELVTLADRYKLRYLVLNFPEYYLKWFERPGTQHWVLRDLAPLYMGRDAYGFRLEHTDNNTLVYRIPRPGEVDLDALPKLPPEPDDFTILLLEPDRGGLTEAPPPLKP